MPESESPDRITLPQDVDLRRILEQKRAEYEARLNPFDHPEIQLLESPDAFLKHRILSELFEKGEIQDKAFFSELVQEFPSPPCIFQATENMDNAWGVIEDYCTNHGKNTVRPDGKTGLGEEKQSA